MNSLPNPPSQLEISDPDRYCLNSLLCEIYGCINHSALHTAQAAASLNGRVNIVDQDSDTEMSDVSTSSLESGETFSSVSSSEEDLDEQNLPEELTMQIVLADALQYLQLLTFETIVSCGAQDYSLPELVVTLTRLLEADAKGVEDVRMTTSDMVDYLNVALRAVLVQLERGNFPIEPVGR